MKKRILPVTAAALGALFIFSCSHSSGSSVSASPDYTPSNTIAGGESADIELPIASGYQLQLKVGAYDNFYHSKDGGFDLAGSGLIVHFKEDSPDFVAGEF